MRLFKQQGIGKLPKICKNDMHARSGIEGTISQDVQLSIFVVPDTLVLRKSIFNTLLLLLQ